MAGVNGIEIKVGQVWRNDEGALVYIDKSDWGFFSKYVETSRLGRADSVVDYHTADGGTSSGSFRLIELVKDENGKAVAPQPEADSAALAEETLSALGWTFDGQAWVEQPRIDMLPNALDVQVGGTHYKDCAIQPIEYIHANKLGFAEGNVVKYITRHRQKHGADDVRKVIHYCQLLLELEYGAATKEPTNG